MTPKSDFEPSPELRSISTHLSAYDTSTNLSTASLSNSHLSTTATSNLSGTATRFHQQNLNTGSTQNPNFQYYLSLLVTSEDTTSSNPGIEQQQPPTNNIPPATITKNEFLNAIFPFKLEELSNTPLFNGAALEKKPITAMYTDAKINGHSIKLILDNSYQVDCTASTRIMTVDGATKTLIGEIDDFLIKVNGIVVFIKVLVIEATQYQALVVPTMCGHFKATNTTAPLIDFEEEKPKSTWKAYQVLRADKEHNKLLPILLWDDNGKGKQKGTELT
ncbi:hypothetical protein G9A89_021414 [Geosiphon pyriformis]|nr:hypothetical protein G9A89_021414 [Geosiphon pyriformis]